MFLLSLFIFNPAINGLSAPKKLIDRAVLQIGQETHTLRNIQNYLTLLSAYKDDKKILDFSESTWKSNLEIYLQDHLINIEALRLGGFDPTDEKFLKTKTLIMNRLKSWSVINQLESNSPAIDSSIREILRSDEFQLSKSKQQALSRKDKKNAIEKDKDQEWINQLKEKYSYRYFENAASYQKPMNI